MSVVEISSVRAESLLNAPIIDEFSATKDLAQKTSHRYESCVIGKNTKFNGIGLCIEFGRTSDLIQDASKTIEFLSARKEILEAELAQERLGCFEQAEQIITLSQTVQELMSQAKGYESELKHMKIRHQTAESFIVALEQAQKVVTLRAVKAESVSNKLQQQIESAFGHGSPFRSLIEANEMLQAAE